MSKRTTKSKTSHASKPVNKLKVKYLLRQDCRQILMSGAYGGIGPKGLIQLAIFSDRLSLPSDSVVEFSTDPSGITKVSSESSVLEHDGIVREVQVLVNIPLDTAISLRQWLDEKIQNHPQIQQMHRPK